MALTINVPGLSGFTGTIESVGRGIRRGNPIFRSEIDRLRREGQTVTANTPLHFGGGQTGDLLAQLLARPPVFNFPKAAQPPPPPKFFTQPGVGTFRRTEDGGFVLEEDPAAKAIRVRREAAIQDLTRQLTEGISSERLEQIQKTADTFQKRIFERAEKALRQAQLGSGRAGSAFDDANINLAQDTAERAQLFADDLRNRDIQATQNALSLIQGGGDVAAGRALQTSGLASADEFARQQLLTNTGLSQAAGQADAGLGLLSQVIGRQQGLENLAFNRQNQVLNRRDLESRSRRQKTSDIAGIGGGIATGLLTGGAGGAVRGRLVG